MIRSKEKELSVPRTEPGSELSLISAVLVDPENFDRVSELVRGRDFEDPDLGVLFDSLLLLREAGIPLSDVRAVVPELRKLKVPESVCEPATLFKIVAEGRAHAAHAVFYAKEISRGSKLRAIYRIAIEAAEKSSLPDASPDSVSRWIAAQIRDAAFSSNDTPRPIGEIAREVCDSLCKSRAKETVFSGLRGHDETTGGWRPGELIVLAARPGVGKTSLALQVAEFNARKQRRVLFVSLEMSAQELAGRILCAESGGDYRGFRAGKLGPADREEFEYAANGLSGIPLEIWAPAEATLESIRAVARRAAAAAGLELLVVDYLGLVRPEDRTRRRYEQVGEISVGLKALSKELEIPVLALSQLNREADGTEPRLAHLRESGSIEQDADVVLLLHRTDRENLLIVAKHRHGETGRIRVGWDPEKTRFFDVRPEVEDFGPYGSDDSF